MNPVEQLVKPGFVQFTIEELPDAISVVRMLVSALNV